MNGRETTLQLKGVVGKMTLEVTAKSDQSEKCREICLEKRVSPPCYLSCICWLKIIRSYAFIKFPESRPLRATIMPCDICALVSAEIGSNTCPPHRALERIDMAFQLAKIASALERATDAIIEAGRQLDDCRMVVRLARPESNEPLPEEE